MGVGRDASGAWHPTEDFRWAERVRRVSEGHRCARARRDRPHSQRRHVRAAAVARARLRVPGPGSRLHGGRGARAARARADRARTGDDAHWRRLLAPAPIASCSCRATTTPRCCFLRSPAAWCRRFDRSQGAKWRRPATGCRPTADSTPSTAISSISAPTGSTPGPSRSSARRPHAPGAPVGRAARPALLRSPRTRVSGPRQRRRGGRPVKFGLAAEGTADAGAERRSGSATSSRSCVAAVPPGSRRRRMQPPDLGSRQGPRHRSGRFSSRRCPTTIVSSRSRRRR